MAKEKILALGNYTDSMYHPFGGVDEQLKRILQEQELVCTDQTDKLLRLSEEGFAGVISYLDIWDSELPAAQAQALCRFVEQGGACMLLHNGISIQNREELRKLAGARFITHPPQEPITFCPKDHPVTAGCAAFTLTEEPYRFEMEQDSKKLLLSYLYRGEEYPAGWCRHVGDGKVVFLTPGHTAEIFKCPEYGLLIQKSMKWLMEK